DLRGARRVCGGALAGLDLEPAPRPPRPHGLGRARGGGGAGGGGPSEDPAPPRLGAGRGRDPRNRCGGRARGGAARAAPDPGLLAVPAAARLDAARPWLDYRHWNWGASPLDGGESFVWDHSYGPLDWHRTGQTLLDVKSDSPHYWRTAVLDRFDGFRWITSDE